ncbi:MAG: PAS domain S-box protein [Geobacter sp.]|nr:PAS domain S-box protein [Geobacter sp.]
MPLSPQILYAISSGNTEEAVKLLLAAAQSSGITSLLQALVETAIAESAKIRAVEAEHSRLISAIEQSTDVIVITDRQGVIIYANPAFEHSTGYTLREAAGQNPRILKSGMQDDTFYRGMWETITAGRSWSGRFVNRKKDGSFYIEDATITPVRNSAGEISSFVAVKRDISEHLKLHEEREILEAKLIQAQKMDAIGRLAGGIAHDFNNMLNVILGYTELSLETLSEDSQVRDNLLQIQSAGKRSADLTRQLLAFSRKQPAEPANVNLNTIIEENMSMIRRMIGEEITINFIPDNKLWQVCVDTSQLEQILTNLAVNSRDAISGFGTITIETFNFVFDSEETLLIDLLPGDYVGFTFSDTGCGMSHDILSHIFEPFFTTKAEGHGTGLGMATVYGIIKQNHGEILVESEPERGAMFTIYLPAVHELTAPEKREHQAICRLNNSETILVVEDEPQILELAVMLLEGAGYRVLATTFPEEALTICANKQENIDLLLTDVVMPVINGKDLFTRIEEMRPEIRVLFMSGYTSDIIACHGIIDEGTRFIHKPFEVRTLLAKIREILDS